MGIFTGSIQHFVAETCRDDKYWSMGSDISAARMPAIVGDCPGRETLGMGQVARGEAVHGIVFTSVQSAGAVSPVGDGGSVAEFGPNSATFGVAPH